MVPAGPVAGPWAASPVHIICMLYKSVNLLFYDLLLIKNNYILGHKTLTRKEIHYNNKDLECNLPPKSNTNIIEYMNPNNRTPSQLLFGEQSL